MIMNKNVLLLILLCISGSALGGPLAHEKITVFYFKSDTDSIDLHGLAIEGQKQVAPNFLLGGAVARMQDKSGVPSGYSINGTLLRLNLLGLAKISNETEITGGLRVDKIRVDLKAPSGSDTEKETFKDIVIIFLFAPAPAFEFDAEVARDLDEDENETTFTLNGHIFIDEKIAFGFGYAWDTSDSGYKETQVTFRYDFL